MLKGHTVLRKRQHRSPVPRPEGLGHKAWNRANHDMAYGAWRCIQGTHPTEVLYAMAARVGILEIMRMHCLRRVAGLLVSLSV